jgi:23S rRNA pseudouridine1911/1915/1917 synthase
VTPAPLVVGEEHAGRRLDVVLAELLGVSRSVASARIVAGDVEVDGRPASKSSTVTGGESIVVADAPTPERPVAPPMPPVRYRDEHLLVVAKPPGLVVHPGAGHDGDTLVDACRAAGIALAEADDPARPGIVHRLDRDTSGLLVLATSEAARSGLVDALRERRVSRRYVALTVGVPAEERGRIEAPIGRDPRQRSRFAVVHGGKEAVTRYRVLASGGIDVADRHEDVALVVCELETGRTHQIRVHLTAIGTPVVGDPVYGPRAALAAALGLDRPALHAAALSFEHPVVGGTIELEEPLPADLVRACERAGISPPEPGVRA